MKYKSDEVKEGYDKIHPLLKEILLQADAWLKQRGHEMTLTETISNPKRDKELGRVSVSHSEYRAVDIRTNDFKKPLLVEFIAWINTKYVSFGAISLSTKKRVFAVYHDNGNGEHIHCQLGKDVIEKYKDKYNWEYPKHEVKNGRSTKSSN